MLRARERSGDGGAPRLIDDAEAGESTGGDDERVYLCRACRAMITTRAMALVVDGQQEHTFFNPAGVMYEIGCWAAAPGCVARGIPTSEFTWFRGYRWSYAICRGCDELLGWRFTGAGRGGFWGLITSRLVEEDRGLEG